MAFAEDLSVFFSEDDFAVPVVMGTVVTTGIQDVADDVVLDQDRQAGVMGRIRVVRVPTRDVEASGLAVGGTLTVDGAVRTARLIEAEDDGAITIIALRG